MRETKTISLSRMMYALLLTFITSLTAIAQPGPPAGFFTPVASRNGFSLQKGQSVNSIRTGEIFSYYLTFSIPAGATNVVIYDNVPQPLVIDAVLIPSGGYGGIVTPTVSVVGNSIAVNFGAGPISSSISGSIVIHVHFPVDKTCDGMQVRNNGVLIATGVEIKTDDLIASSIVNNPWKIRKRQNPAFLVGNICQPLTTTYGSTSTTVQYTVDITKTNGTVFGSSSLYNVSLADLLPPGATVIPGSSQSPQLTTTANVPPCSINSAGVVTFSTPFTLDATVNPTYSLTFSVVHSNLSANACEVNRMVLSGNYNCNGTPSATYYDTARVGVRLIPSDSTSPVLSKSVQLNGNVPGCTGKYTIRVRNNGPGVMGGYILRDTFPACLIVGPAVPTAPAGCTITQISSSPVIFEMRTNPGTTLGALQNHDYTISFTIGNGCGTTVVNAVSADSGFTGRAVRSFPLLPPVAKPCIVKQICNTPAIYNLGDQVRFRLRVQNLGAVPLSNINITDQLDAANLEYIGNESYYWTNTVVNNQACGNIPTGSNPWAPHVTTTNVPGSTNLAWHVDTIPVECGSVANTVCGQGNGLRAYYIEFTVRIKDTAGIGNIKNIVNLVCDSVTTPVSSYVTLVTQANLNYSIDKLVSSDNGNTFTTGTTAAPGSSVQYKLGCNNLGIPLAVPTIVDLLPRDNIGGTIEDNFILSPADRGSNVDVRYVSLLFNSHTIAGSGQFYSSNTGITTLPELGFTVNTNSPAWSSSVIPGTANIKTTFSQAIGTAPAFSYVFGAQVDPQAHEDMRACNTYAIRPYAKYLTNYTASLVPQPPLESGPVCLITTKPECCDPVSFDIPKEVCVGISQQFCVTDTCGTNQYYWDFGDGTPLQTGNCVSHTYTTSNGYNIKLIWVNACGENSKLFDIKVKDCPCDVRAVSTISVSGNSITADGSLSVSSLPIAVYVWNFGDGSVGTGQIVTHTYSTPGTYLVTLTVYVLDSHGGICECFDKCITEIKVDPGADPAEYRCGFIRREALRTADRGINIKTDISLKATPNPFKESVRVSFSMTAAAAKALQPGNYRLDFANSNGTVLQTKAVGNFTGTVSFQTGSYPSGTYIIMLKNAAGEINSIKVVKLQ